MSSRRHFIRQSLAAGAALSLSNCVQSQPSEQHRLTEGDTIFDTFKKIERTPIFQREKLSTPLVIEQLGVFSSGKHYFLKVQAGGLSGIAVGNKKYIRSIYPIINNRIFPIVKGKDARDIDQLLDDIYLKKLNYKWQGLAFWVGVAYLELALLDLLGKAAEKPIGELLGGRVRDQAAIYYASGNRGNRPIEEIDYLKKLVEKSGAKAVKWRLGARMRYDAASTKRDRALIPLVRRELGDDATLYVDANGSYDVPMGIETGKILEEYNYDFYEEPCRFDHYQETRAVAAGLNIPVAGGEEEVSMRNLMRLVEDGTYKIVQPDLLFFGGLIRSIKIARMAEVVGINCTPHISGSGLGFLYMMQFASCVPNIGPYQEFKGNKDQVPVICQDSSLQPNGGLIEIPKGPGLGVSYEKGFIEKGKRMD